MEPSYMPSESNYVRAEAVPIAPPPPRRKSVLGGLFLLFLLGVLGVSLLVNLVLFAGGSAFTGSPRVEERYFSHNQRGKDKVAIITVEGTILDGRGFVKRQIERVVKDKNVKAVVLRVNSPGGTVSGSDFIHHHLKKMLDERQVPMVVSMGSMAASGGYYVAMAVGSRSDSIFAEPTTWTGSIGVMIPHFNAAQFMEDWGIQQDSVVSHRLKGMGSFTRKMTEEERAIFQALVDVSFAGFKDIVKQGRPKFQKDPAALDKIATGQVFTARQAIQNGLIDKIGFVEDAVDQAIKLAGLSSDEVRVIDYKPEFSLLDLAFGEAGSRQRGFDLDALVELASPKAYYLCTWLPPLLSNRQ
jgi:protease-4